MSMYAMTNVVWLVVMILFALLELATTSLVAIWFVVGGLAGLAASFLHMRLVSQFAAFVLVSGAALIVTRPLVRRWTGGRTVHTNADRVLDKTGRVTEEVSEEQGAVYVDGKEWSARSSEPDLIPVGAHVNIERIEGVKLYVSRADD